MHANNRRRLSTLTRLMAAAVLALAGGAWTGPRQRPAENGVTSTTITFGQTAPQSGPAALYGQSEWGVLAEFAAVNAHGGVQGRKLRLISLDDQNRIGERINAGLAGALRAQQSRHLRLSQIPQVAGHIVECTGELAQFVA